MSTQAFIFLIIYTVGSFFFFFNDTATTEIYTLSLHDALPISPSASGRARCRRSRARCGTRCAPARDRKSTRLNSSHSQISYAVFCLKKKKKNKLWKTDSVISNTARQAVSPETSVQPVHYKHQS